MKPTRSCSSVTTDRAKPAGGLADSFGIRIAVALVRHQFEIDQAAPQAKEFVECRRAVKAQPALLAVGTPHRRAAFEGFPRLRPPRTENNVVIVFGAELTGEAIRRSRKIWLFLPGQNALTWRLGLRELAGASDMGFCRTCFRICPRLRREGARTSSASFGAENSASRIGRARIWRPQPRGICARFIRRREPVKTFAIDAKRALGNSTAVVQDLFLTEPRCSRTLFCRRRRHMRRTAR